VSLVEQLVHGQTHGAVLVLPEETAPELTALKRQGLGTAAASEPSWFSNNCPNQYWNGGPPGTLIANLEGAWTGAAQNDPLPTNSAGALSPYGVWSDTTTAPDLNTSGINTRYASALSAASVTPATHFVIDTSRNGNGPNDMVGDGSTFTNYSTAPYDQQASVISTLRSGNWCNPPGSGLGLAPRANTGNPLVDAYLWVKIPGESDGQCDSAGGARAWDYSAYSQPAWPTTTAAQALFDPLWGMIDPAAGAWFPQQAIQITRDANESTSAPGSD
jgi:endoglucanase